MTPIRGVLRMRSRLAYLRGRFMYFLRIDSAALRVSPSGPCFLLLAVFSFRIRADRFLRLHGGEVHDSTAVRNLIRGQGSPRVGVVVEQQGRDFVVARGAASLSRLTGRHLRRAR